MTAEAVTSRRIRQIILEQSYRAHVGHIGSCLSIADILAVLYRETLRITDPEDSQRDRFILSKGHAALALYAALHLRGWISEQEIQTFCGTNSRLGTHPERVVPGIDFSAGSLGFGLSYGVGAVLAARLEQVDRRVVVLLSDAECNEGSTWEAVMSAAHHKLSNLMAIVDCNGQQAFGYTREVMDLSPLVKRWDAFGWDATEEDGHDVASLARAMRPRQSGKPQVIIAKTIFGKGVSFMEGQIPWHYQPMSEEQYRQAMREIDQP